MSEHDLASAIASRLESRLKSRRVVTVYDERSEIEGFIDDLDVVGVGLGGLPRVAVGDTMAHLARYDGSYFALKAAIEPVVEADRPEPLVIYLPGVEYDARVSPLLELDKAGEHWSPQLKRMARDLLRKRWSDADIDAMLAPEGLKYQDIAAMLGHGAGSDGPASLLKLALGPGDSEALIARWLGDEDTDQAIQNKQAEGELYRLVEGRLGLGLEGGLALSKARHRTLRYVLVNEFRGDLQGPNPAGLDTVPEAKTQEQRQRVRTVAQLLRAPAGAERYRVLADGVEQELGLAKSVIAPDRLGAIDTFRFEERALLAHAAALLERRDAAGALKVIDGRRVSFWVERDLERLAQWELCRMLAELIRETERVKSLVAPTMKAAEQVRAYAAPGGWHEVDRARRAVEAAVANMVAEPEDALEKVLGRARRDHEDLLEQMARGFTDALVASAWQVPGVLEQTRIYPEKVAKVGARVAYFFVDAMRYEMGAELAAMLGGVQDMALVPAVVQLPSITPVGMAALLPEASESFSVVDHGGRLASRIGSTDLDDVRDRMKFLKARRADAVEIELGGLLQKTAKALASHIEGKALVIVRSQAIDGLGEMDGALVARQIMETLIGNLARAAKKLARAGIEYFVITADHGHQFSLPKEGDMTIAPPGGQKVDLHRRCWAGRGGATPDSCVRVAGSALGYDTDLEFVFPKGIAVFKAGGDLAYHHGGVSLQEMVVPVLSFRIPPAAGSEPRTTHVKLMGIPAALTTRTLGVQVLAEADLLDTGPLAVRVVLQSDKGLEVGGAGMAMEAELDRKSGRLVLERGKPAMVGLLLKQDREISRVRVVVLDFATDAVLGQSADMTLDLKM